MAGCPDVSVAALWGERYEMLERGFAPSAEEALRMLIKLRGKLRWSRPAMAAFLGVSKRVLRRWETGQRHPSGAARRLIWLMDLLVHDPDKLKNAMDLIFWGEGEECLEDAKQFAK